MPFCFAVVNEADSTATDLLFERHEPVEQHIERHVAERDLHAVGAIRTARRERDAMLAGAPSITTTSVWLFCCTPCAGPAGREPTRAARRACAASTHCLAQHFRLGVQLHHSEPDCDQQHGGDAASSIRRSRGSRLVNQAFIWALSAAGLRCRCCFGSRIRSSTRSGASARGRARLVDRADVARDQLDTGDLVAVRQRIDSQRGSRIAAIASSVVRNVLRLLPPACRRF